MLVRVIIEEDPTFYRMLGLQEESECTPQVNITHDLTERVYCRVQSKPTYVLYRLAVQPEDT